MALSACGGGGDSPAPPPPVTGNPPPPPPPPPPPAVTARIAAGSDFSMALRLNATVACWGDQQSGQLGNDVVDGSSQRRPQAVLGLDDAVRIAAGRLHAVALRSNGTLVAWGNNLDGKLGIGLVGGLFSTPQAIAGLTGVVAIAAGADHTLALRDDRTVWAWGWNDVGQLGLGDGQPRMSPTQVPSLTDVVSISAGEGHSLALRSDGTVWAWGWNANGQLGLGSISAPVPMPTRVVLLNDRGVVELAGGSFHTLARIGLGAVLAWGANNRGQTGTAPPGSGNVLEPTVVPGLLGVTALAAGETHSLVLRSDRTIRTWGNAADGRLGNGADGVTQSTDVPQIPNVSQVTAIAAGKNHSMVLVADGRVGCFGSNFFSQCGQIGLGSVITPQAVPDFTVGP